MNLRLLLAALAAAAAIGILVVLLRLTLGVDADLHAQRLALIRAIDNLDVQLNRTIMQSRFTTLAQVGDERVRITNELGEALARIGASASAMTPADAAADYTAGIAEPGAAPVDNQTVGEAPGAAAEGAEGTGIEASADAPAEEAAPDPFAGAPAELEAAPLATPQAGDYADSAPTSLRGLSPALDAALDRFTGTIGDKFALAFDYEARNTLFNQRLITNLDAVPVHAAAVKAAARGPARDRIEELVGRLTAEVAAHAVTPTPTNGDAIRALLDELAGGVAGQPPALREAAALLRTRVDELLADKGELVQRLNDFLDRPTTAQLREVEQAYTDWHQERVARANGFRAVLGVYAFFLMVALGIVGWRLRTSYHALDIANASLQKANLTLEDQVEERTRDLKEAMRHLRESEAQLVQSEKMASLGQMVAGVAHEINTPLGYARSNASIVRQSLADIKALCHAQAYALQLITTQASDEDVAIALSEAQHKLQTVNPEELAGDLDNLLADSDHGLSQIAELVASLKDFSRVDRSRHDHHNLNQSIESALKIAHNQLKHRVEVVKSLGTLPKIECAPSQLNQVFLNLITNAAQAIEGPGKIFVHTAPADGGDAVIARVLDTGCGMSEEVRARIFEPFFTTKAVGKGTGLGLSIVYRIIEDHGGRIEVKSAVGKGTEFIITLPLKQKRRPATDAPTPPADPEAQAPARAAA